MSRTVIILGAGASVEAGAPLMADFIDAAERILQQRDDPEQVCFERVFRALHALHSAQSKILIDANNLESVYNAFEMAEMLGVLEGHTADELTSLPPSLRRVITRTLERTIRFPVNDLGPLPTKSYGIFAKHVNEAWRKDKGSVCVLTFNYDLCVDIALELNVLQIDYGLQDEPISGLFPLLKLHGSLNWFDNQMTGRIGVIPRGKLVLKRTSLSDSYCGVEVSPAIEELKSRGESGPTPIIVPPTWSKRRDHLSIRTVWRRAARELQNAEYIHIVGYSYPQTDGFFRELLAIGLLAPTRIKRVVVYNPDTSEETKQRFLSLLGPSTQSRFAYEPVRFNEALTLLSRALGEA